ncbi:unnamed protein product, partial [Schistosoma turkestanicum]
KRICEEEIALFIRDINQQVNEIALLQQKSECHFTIRVNPFLHSICTGATCGKTNEVLVGELKNPHEQFSDVVAVAEFSMIEQCLQYSLLRSSSNRQNNFAVLILFEHLISTICIT